MTGASKNSIKSKAAGDRSQANAVDAVFKAYPQPAKTRLLALRRLILATAKATRGVGRIEEALKWGQPSYLTTETKSGSTVRIDHVAGKHTRSTFIARPISSRRSANSIPTNGATAAIAASCSTPGTRSTKPRSATASRSL